MKREAIQEFSCQFQNIPIRDPYFLHSIRQPLVPNMSMVAMAYPP